MYERVWREEKEKRNLIKLHSKTNYEKRDYYKCFITLCLYEWGKMKSQGSFNMNFPDY